MFPLSKSTLRKLAAAMICLGGMLAAESSHNRAEAAPPPGKWVKEYQVQVEYWYWDTEYYGWSTVYRSESPQAAGFVYGVSQLALSNGTLNQLWPHSNWKFLAVDVRLISVWKFKPAPVITDSIMRLP